MSAARILDPTETNPNGVVKFTGVEKFTAPDVLRFRNTEIEPPDAAREHTSGFPSPSISPIEILCGAL
jgi:hypothetical protein